MDWFNFVPINGVIYSKGFIGFGVLSQCHHLYVSYTHTHIHARTRTHTHTHTHKPMHTHACTHAYTCTYSRIHIQTLTSTTTTPAEETTKRFLICFLTQSNEVASQSLARQLIRLLSCATCIWWKFHHSVNVFPGWLHFPFNTLLHML